MDLKERIAAQFGGEDLHQVEVPEWGEDGKPLVVYYRRATLRQISDAAKLANGDQFLINARLVAAKALDVNGKPLFRQIDAAFLMDSADPTVIGRIANAMSGSVSGDEAEKN